MLKKYISNLALWAIFIGFLAGLVAPLEAGAADRRSSSRRTSSDISRKIRALGDDPVKEFAIPILLGVTQANLRDSWGEARSAGRTHEGIDIFAQRGAFIVSPTDAVVTTATIESDRNSLGGTYVYTTNPGGERFYYAHLDSIARGIVVGKVLKKGDLIGYVGNTGNASGGATHLHLGIRAEDGATNPYPRLTEQFSDQERMEALEKILDDADSADILAKTIVSQYRSYLLGVKAKGVELPVAIANALILNSVTVLPSSVPSTVSTVVSGPRSLTLGSQGSDVTKLQQFLITQDKGTAAEKLVAAGSTGFFGSITQDALAEYQASVGISPASGYFGPITRNYLQLNNLLSL